MEHKLFYFQLLWKVYIVISTIRKIQIVPHCGKYQKGLSTLWKSSLFILWNIYSTCLHLSLQISGDFHKSFCNLPNFFCEHARGARSIFHLWLCCSATLFIIPPYTTMHYLALHDIMSAFPHKLYGQSGTLCPILVASTSTKLIVPR